MERALPEMADNIDSPRKSTGPESEPAFHVSTSAASAKEQHALGAPGPVEKSLPTVMLPGVIAIAVLTGISVWIGQMSASEAKPATPPATAVASTPPAPAPIDLLATEVKGIKTQYEGLVSQLKGIQGKLDGLPKPTPPPDLKPIQGKLDDLATSVTSLLPLSDKVSKLETQAGSVETEMKGFGDRLAGLSGAVQRISAAKPVTIGETPKPAATPITSTPSLGAAIDLFKAGKLQEAGEAFKKLEASSPSDPRVYYYEAFINAMTTNDWQGGETLRLAAKGAAAEKTGATKPADIDSAFVDLPANLKNWLTFFRNQGK